MALDLDELEAFEREQQAPASRASVIIDAMSKGISEDAIAGLLDMTREEFAELAKTDPEVKRALEIGEAKGALYLERLALVAAAGGSNPVLMAMLRARLGWDNQEAEKGATLIVEVKKFIDAKERKKDTDPE